AAAGGRFSHSVILLIQTGSHGALGLIVNRPTQVPLRRIVSRRVRLKHAHKVYAGGPVARGHITLLIRAEKKPPDALHVTGNVYVSDNVSTLKALTSSKYPKARFRAYAGYAGWGPG